jgi:hypothetical protein
MPISNIKPATPHSNNGHSVSRLLRTVSYERNRLEMIIEALAGLAFRKGHVRDIAKEMSRRNPDWIVEKPEEAVTRTINNHCAEAQDFGVRGQSVLFKRVEPATYQLEEGIIWHDFIGHDQQLRWTSPAQQLLWERYSKAQRDNSIEWTNRKLFEQLVDFAVYLQRPDAQTFLQKWDVQ